MADSTSGRCTCACLCQSDGLEDLSMSSFLLARKRLVHFPLLASWWGARDRTEQGTNKEKQKRAKQKPAFEVTMAKGPAPAEVRWLGMVCVCVCVCVCGCVCVFVCVCVSARLRNVPRRTRPALMHVYVCVCVSDYCACPGGGRCTLERVHERLDLRGVLRG